MFIHLVFLKLHTTDDAIEAKRRLESMLGKVDSLRSVEVGINQIHSGRSWDMSLHTSFDDQSGYESYATDPYHLEMLKWLKEKVKQSATVDYMQTS